jgi:hypothetical protein
MWNSPGGLSILWSKLAISRDELVIIVAGRTG